MSSMQCQHALNSRQLTKCRDLVLRNCSYSGVGLALRRTERRQLHHMIGKTTQFQQSQPIPRIRQLHRRYNASIRFLTSRSDRNSDVKSNIDPDDATEMRSESEWRDMTMKLSEIDIGSMTVDDFLDTEDVISWWCTSDKFSEESIQYSMRLFKRLIEENSNNPQMLEEFEMVHWFSGNVPRSLKLLTRITSNWRHAWVNNETDFSPKQMLAFIDDVVNIASSSSSYLQIDNQIYSVIMRAAIKRGPKSEAPMIAQKILDTMIHESKINDKPMAIPDAVTFSIAMDAWAKSGLADAPEKAEDLLETMTILYEEGLIEERPNTFIYTSLMTAWLESRRESAPEEIQRILEYMIEQLDPKLVPDTYNFRIAIHAWARSKLPRAASQAHKILLEMVRLWEAGSSTIQLDSDFFGIVIKAYADSRDCNNKAEEVFNLLQDLYSHTGNRRLKPDIKVLRAMVIALAYNAAPGSSGKAEDMLQHMVQLAESTNNPKLMPKRSYFNDVINSWANSGETNAAFHAEGVLLKQLELHYSGIPGMLPDTYAFNRVLSLWARSTHQVDDAAERAEALLRVMQNTFDKTGDSRVKPREDSFSHVLTAWSRNAKDNKEAPERATKLFHEMKERSNNGEVDLKPNKIHYTTLLATYGRNRHPNFAKFAVAIFNDFSERYKAGDQDFRPDNKLYGALISVFAKNSDGKNAEAVFVRMIDEHLQGNTSAQPDCFVFNQVLKAWFDSKQPGAAKKAELVFENIKSLTESGVVDLQPDATTYFFMTFLWLREKEEPSAAEYAAKYLRMMDANHPGYFDAYTQTVVAFARGGMKEPKSTVDQMLVELSEMTMSNDVPLPERDSYIRFLKAVAKVGSLEMSERAQIALKRKEFDAKPGLLL